MHIESKCIESKCTSIANAYREQMHIDSKCISIANAYREKMHLESKCISRANASGHYLSPSAPVSPSPVHRHPPRWCQGFQLPCHVETTGGSSKARAPDHLIACCVVSSLVQGLGYILTTLSRIDDGGGLRESSIHTHTHINTHTHTHTHVCFRSPKST
jgi:hypothetical protein